MPSSPPEEHTNPRAELWRCGHEKTPENTGKSGAAHPHGTCRICRNRRALADYHNRKPKKEPTR